MKIAKDTFLVFLHDNLSTLTPPITVHAMRKDPDRPDATILQNNALNVGFGKIDFGVSISCIYAKLDVVADSELTASDIVTKTWLLLSKRFYTEMYDYTDPSNPVATGTMLMWEPNKVKFSPVLYEKEDRYFRYSSTLPLEYHY